MNSPNLDLAPIAPASMFADAIPTIDLGDPSAKVIDAVAEACRTWGFFQVIGHGVRATDMDQLLSVSRQFFAQPAAEKRRVLRTRDNPWGYYDRELTKEQRDKKAVFDIGPDAAGVVPSPSAPFAGTTRWPAVPSEFAPVIQEYVGSMARLSSQLIGLIGASLTGDPDALRASFEPHHTSFLRLNYYPVEDPLAGEELPTANLGVHHHSDAGALTILLQAGVGGLQLYRDGHWHDVPPVAGAFTINIGDMVQIWSNDLYPAPIHRVLAMSERDRFSFPYFCNPSYDAIIAPLGSDDPHYRPIHWGEFRRRRADGDFADYGTEVQISDYRLA